MSFRFNNPLRRAANTQTSINRGIGQFGQVSQALTEFNDVQKSIGRISSSVGQISGNASSLQGTITNVSSAGDVLNGLSGNSSLQNTFRSVSALTRDVQSLVPGNSRVASQAATISKRAEDFFANTQRNAQGIKGITGGITDVLNGTLDVGNLSNRSLGPLTGGLNLGQLTSSLGNITGINSNITSQIAGITGSAPELQNIRNNPISVVPRSVAELTNPIGERYDVIREQYERQTNATTFDDYVNNSFQPLTQIPLGEFDAFQQRSFGGPNSGAGNSYSRVPNPLRNYSSFNYIITLGILDAEEYNNPAIYRSAGGFKNYIIKSGGGNYAKRYQVDAEFNNDNPGDAEYFIDNLEIDAAIAPNPNTSVSLGTSLTFSVQEPFSMGNFIEAIIGASAAAGFQNYLDAPFCLRIDFVGWDEYGSSPQQASLVNPIFIPVKFTKIDFNVDGKGSIYEVKAVPMSESALGDDINEIKTPINANGDFVHTVLETGARSVSNIMNSRVEALEDADVIAPYDRYAIVFPKSRKEFQDYLERDVINEEALRIDVNARIRDAIGGDITVENATAASQLRRSYEQQNQNIISATVNSVGRTYAKIKTFAEDVNAMNAIGSSILVEEVGTGGNQAHGSQAGTGGPDDGSRGSPARNSAELAPAERSRDYQFSQGMTITEVIERIVLNSEYARENATEPPNNGIKKWFKIDTYTFIEPNPQTESQLGRPPRVYVFSIIPYDADEAKFNAPNERPANTEGLKASAAKEYNYIYTGKNEDVLDFNISFNNAFMQTSFANFGQNAAGVAGGNSTSLTQRRDKNTGSQLSQNSGAGGNSATGQTQEKTTFQSAGYGDAVQDGDIRRRITEMLHDRMINQTIDMVTAEMEIFGDPFFIPQEMGNFVSSPGNSPNTSQEGTMRYQESEVFTVVNFKTPFDYQVEGATMEFPQTVPQFSGLFSIWAVTNVFNGGKFTQRLKLIRRRGQDDPATDNNRGPVQENESSNITDSESTGDTATGNTDANVGATSGNSPTTPNPHSTAPSTNTAPVSAANPEGVRFGSMDQALNSARAYQQANPGYTYAVKQGDNGGWTIGPRPNTQPTTTTTSPDLSNRVQPGTQSQPPTSPAC